jgi:hypothetical protein
VVRLDVSSGTARLCRVKLGLENKCYVMLLKRVGKLGRLRKERLGKDYARLVKD